MAPPHVNHLTDRPSDRGTPPPDVTDPLLWALAVDVAAAHRPGPDGTCANLQCRGQHGACWALRTAHRAAHQARRATDRPPAAAPLPALPQPLPRRTTAARGRATVPPTAQRFTGWFTPPTAQAPPATRAAVPEPIPNPPVVVRRPPVAALVA